MTVLLVGLGGFGGAVLRYVVDGWIAGRGSAFPFGTLAVNVTGSLALGLLFALTIERAVVPASVRAPVMVGFIGAYTTFSTYMLESWRLLEDGSWTLAITNLVGSVILGLVSVAAGLALGRWI
ncbi:MAG: fluoride efflux transporter CrcB [Chloroflexota bacterium]|nr:fluoride efflux transporter CrcB [Chloroflexota bacterium]MDE3193482.1 fluoride efflux transporter CrcB [Chloroflexota bacterium]